MVTVTRLNTTPSRPRVELWRNFRVKLEAHLEQSRSPWHQRVTRMIEGRGQTLSDLNHHEATGTRKEVIRQPLSPRFGCCGLSSVGYRRTSAAIRARGLHAPTAPKFMEITLSPKNGRPHRIWYTKLTRASLGRDRGSGDAGLTRDAPLGAYYLSLTSLLLVV